MNDNPADKRSFSQQDYLAVAEAIRQRATTKVLAQPDQPVPTVDGDSEAPFRDTVHDALNAASWAPFHYARNVDGLAEPWRTYTLWGPLCRKLSVRIPQWFDNMRPQNKLPAMLAACDCLVLVHWIPQFSGAQNDGQESVSESKQQQIDEEHLAATAAYVQNLLVLLTARNQLTYWSSGGFFRESEMKQRLGIPLGQRLLAAIFVNDPVNTDASKTEWVPGKNRDARSPLDRWNTEISFDL